MATYLITHALGISFYRGDEVPTFNAVQGSIYFFGNASADSVCIYQNADGGTLWRLYFPGTTDEARMGFLLRVPITGNLTVDVNLPARSAFDAWRLADAWLVNGTGAAAGTGQIRNGSGTVITDAMARGAANALTQAATIDVGVSLSNDGPIRFVTAGCGGGDVTVLYALLW